MKQPTATMEGPELMRILWAQDLGPGTYHFTDAEPVATPAPAPGPNIEDLI